MRFPGGRERKELEAGEKQKHLFPLGAEKTEERKKEGEEGRRGGKEGRKRE